MKGLQKRQDKTKWKGEMEENSGKAWEVCFTDRKTKLLETIIFNCLLVFSTTDWMVSHCFQITQRNKIITRLGWIT